MFYPFIQLAIFPMTRDYAWRLCYEQPWH